MGFNRNDLEDDDFNFDDDSLGDNGDEFDFGDEPADIGLDDDDSGFGFEGEDMPDIDEEGESEGGGVSRTFIIIAALMILLFVGGLVAVLLIANGGNVPTEFEQTSTAVAILNSTTVAQLAGTQTQSVFDAATGTALALVPTATPSPTETLLPPTETPTTVPPTLDQTQQAASALQTQAALEGTQTAEALLFSPTPQEIDAGGVALTATALAELLAPRETLDQGGGGIASPTAEGVIATPGGTPTELPETGFIEDNIGLIALLAAGLVAVIFVSRRLRVANSG
jgi:hypothetical protein